MNNTIKENTTQKLIYVEKRNRRVGAARCIHGDCMDTLRGMHAASVDFILTDVPYELTLKGGIDGGKYFSYAPQMQGEQSALVPMSDGIDCNRVFHEMERVCRKVNICLFCSTKQVGRFMTWWERRGYSVTLLVWEKPSCLPLGNMCYLNNLEFIIYVREQGATFNSLGYSQQLKSFHDAVPHRTIRLHPAQKPVPLLERLLSIHTKEGDTVLDPYAGSFSTAVACQKMGRRFIGCEINPDYFNAGVERLIEAVNNNQ